MKLRSIFGILPPLLKYSAEVPETVDIPLPDRAIIALKSRNGQSLPPALKRGDQVKTGQRILSTDGIFLAFSPVTGTVESIYDFTCVDCEAYIAVEVKTSEDIDDDTLQGTDNYLDKNRAEIFPLLQDGGIDTFTGFEDGAAGVVLNCMESDLSVSIIPLILKEKIEALREGLKLLKRLFDPAPVILTAPQSLKSAAEALTKVGDKTLARVICLRPVYPAGMKEIVALRVAGRKGNPRSICVISPDELLSTITFLKDGHPSFTKFLTLIGSKGNPIRNYQVRIGTPVREVLAAYNINLGNNDRMILGGPMRGTAVYHTSFPVRSDLDALHIQRNAYAFRPRAEPCVGCGKCLAVCPMNLQVNLITRYSEFSHFEECSALDINSCIECGLCAYECISGRPLVQYITYAKNELKKKAPDNE